MSVFSEDGSIWNFAYGSNMNKGVLEGRRGISPIESAPAVLQGWRLSFNLQTVPFLEPGMGNVVPTSVPGAEMHGVAHRLSARDFKRLCLSEGGAGESSDGYQLTTVQLRLYDGRSIPAVVLQSIGRRVVSPTKRLMPSKRYVGLLRAGARQHGLDPAYIAYLDELPAYAGHPATKGLVVCFLLSLGLFATPFALPLIIYAAIFKHKRSEVLRVVFTSLSSVTWSLLGNLPNSGLESSISEESLTFIPPRSPTPRI